MKRFFWVFLLLFACASEAAITRVNVVSATTDAAGTTLATAATSHTAGNLLVVAASGFDVTGATLNTVSNTAGDTWTLLTRVTDTNTHGILRLAYTCSTNGHASDIVTVTWSVSVPAQRLIVVQYAGVATSACLDGENTGNSGAGQSTAVLSGSVTTTAANALLVAGITAYGSGTPSAGAGYTAVTTVGAGNEAFFEERFPVTPGAYTATATLSVADWWSVGLAAFKEAGGGAAAPRKGPLWLQ